jgi:hypothetical protein
VLAASDLPYRKLVTWDGEYGDLYHIDLNTGGRQLVVRKLRNQTAQLSPAQHHGTDSPYANIVSMRKHLCHD